jgi:hypothetical protein
MNISFNTLVQGGLALVATGAWAEVGKRFVDSYYPVGHATTLGRLFYAIAVTIFVLMVIWLLNHKKVAQVMEPGYIRSRYTNTHVQSVPSET